MRKQNYGVNASIYTISDKAEMLQHLQNQEDNSADSSNALIFGYGCWLECSYCEETPGSEWFLVGHIIQEHRIKIFHTLRNPIDLDWIH